MYLFFPQAFSNVILQFVQVVTSPESKFMAETSRVGVKEVKWDLGKVEIDQVWIIGSDPNVNFSSRVLPCWNLRACEMKEAMILGQQK